MTVKHRRQPSLFRRILGGGLLLFFSVFVFTRAVGFELPSAQKLEFRAAHSSGPELVKKLTCTETEIEESEAESEYAGDSEASHFLLHVLQFHFRDIPGIVYHKQKSERNFAPDEPFFILNRTFRI